MLYFSLQFLQFFFSLLELIQLEDEHFFLLFFFLKKFLLLDGHTLQPFLQLLLQFLQIFLVDFERILWFLRFLRFFRLFRFIWINSLIKLASFELSLSHESFSGNPIEVVVRALACILEVHQPLNCHHPAPLLIAIPGTKVVLIINGGQFESCWDHIIIFP